MRKEHQKSVTKVDIMQEPLDFLRCEFLQQDKVLSKAKRTAASAQETTQSLRNDVERLRTQLERLATQTLSVGVTLVMLLAEGLTEETRRGPVGGGSA